jgi:hypothetical protein
MNGQGINIKDKNDNKDLVGYITFNPAKIISVTGSFIKGKGCAVETSDINPDIKKDQSYTRDRWSLGSVLKTKPLNLRAEYLAGKHGNVKSEVFYATTNYHACKNIDIILSYD